MDPSHAFNLGYVECIDPFQVGLATWLLDEWSGIYAVKAGVTTVSARKFSPSTPQVNG